MIVFNVFYNCMWHIMPIFPIPFRVSHVYVKVHDSEVDEFNTRQFLEQRELGKGIPIISEGRYLLAKFYDSEDNFKQKLQRIHQKLEAIDDPFIDFVNDYGDYLEMYGDINYILNTVEEVVHGRLSKMSKIKNYLFSFYYQGIVSLLKTYINLTYYFPKIVNK